MNQISGRPPATWLTRAAIVALAAATVVGCSSSARHDGPAASASTPAVQALAHGVEAPLDDIPWSQVGEGWMLAIWAPATPNRAEPTSYHAPATLYLVNPGGGRYAIATFQPEGDTGTPSLVDWSGDGNRALFDNGSKLIEVDLHTGKHTSFALEDGFRVTARYTRPEGKAILLSSSKGENDPPSLERVDLAGNHQLTYPMDQIGDTFDPELLSTPDGTQLVVGTEFGGLAVMGNDGTVTKTLPVPGQYWCTPLRWWDADSTVTVAECHSPELAYQQVWLVPVDGSAPTALTPANDGQEGDILGTGAAWQLPGGIFVQAYGPCGLQILAKIDEVGGMPTPVNVPNVEEHHSIHVVGVNGDDLQLQATQSCGEGESLLSFDPAANTTTELLGASVNGGGVTAALPYPGHE